jgi:hypothetical protein
MMQVIDARTEYQMYLYINNQLLPQMQINPLFARV